MPKTTYTKEEIQTLIAETRNELHNLLKSEGQQISAPAENGGQIKKDEDSGDDSKKKPEESSSSDSGGSDKKSPPAPASDGASASAGGPPAADPASAGGPPAADPASAGSPDGSASAGPADLPTLVAAYSTLSPEELAMHVQALQQVMAAGGAGGAPAAPGAAPGGAPAPASPAAGAPAAPGGAPVPGPDASAPMAGENSKPIDPAMAMKSEKEALEKLVKAQEDRLKTLQGNFETVAKAVELMLTKPQRKAATGRDLAKSQTTTEEKVDITKLSKSELTKKLTSMARNPELKKSERNLINSFYKGEVKVESLAPLFDKK